MSEIKEDKIMKVAVKSRICDLVNGKFNNSQENRHLSYLDSAIGIKLTKARVMATVVQIYLSDNQDKPFGIINIDDSTGTISCRLWNNLDLIKDMKVGDLVDIIGLVREYNNEIYIVPDIIKKINDFNHETLRRLELVESLQKLGIKKKVSEPVAEQPVPEPVDKSEKSVKTTKPDNSKEDKNPKKSNPKASKSVKSPLKVRESLIQKIEELDNGEGADIEEVVSINDSAEDILNELLNEGTCYEPRMGRVKLL